MNPFQEALNSFFTHWYLQCRMYGLSETLSRRWAIAAVRAGLVVDKQRNTMNTEQWCLYANAFMAWKDEVKIWDRLNRFS